MTATASETGAEALDVFVELFDGLEAGPDGGTREFYDRCCEAVCRLTSMNRAGLLLYDDARKLVVPVGSHGLPEELLGQIYGTLEETPVAQRALGEDRVVELADGLEGQVPDRYAHLDGVSTVTCTPVSAGGRWLGVIFADRGGGRFELTDSERHTMLTLGKTAALASSARSATVQQARARLLGERIDLARDIHERVMQRLFGISLVLGSSGDLGPDERVRCAEEIQAALHELRSALSRPLAPSPEGTGATLEEELGRLGRHYGALPLEVTWELREPLPEDLEPLAQSVLAEALRNADKHAEPSRVQVGVHQRDETVVLEVRNDGVTRAEPGPPGGAGMGLRLAAFEALQRGGVVEFGREGDEWRTRLMLPVP